MGRAATWNRPRKRHRRSAVGAAAAAEAPDCFSNLPDDVLLAIASRLPTRLAVSLSILARRFRHLPTLFDHIDSVSLSEPAFPIPLRTSPPLLLRRLALSPPRAVGPSAFRPVLDTAADHGVSELAVQLRRRARLPKNVLSIRSLTVLSLDTCAVPLWSAVACARLRTLKLHRVAVHQEIITAVFAAAPRLETLEMVYCTGFGTGRSGGCTVESSTVRNLLFRPALEQQEVTLRTVGLRTVTLYTRPKMLRVQLAPAPEVRKAYLHVDKPRGKLEFRIRPFLDAGTGLACLTLRGLATMVSFAPHGLLVASICFPQCLSSSEVRCCS